MEKVGPQQGLLTWAQRLLDRWKIYIMGNSYGNDKAALEKLKASKVKKEQKLSKKVFPEDGVHKVGNFTPMAFLVSYLMNTSAAIICMAP